MVDNERNEKGKFLKGHKSYPRQRMIKDNSIVKLYLEGKTTNQIAENLGISLTPIYQTLKENNIKIKEKGFENGNRYILKKGHDIGKKTRFKKGHKSLHTFPKGHKLNLGKKYPIELYPNWGTRKTIMPLEDTKIEVKIQNFLKELGIDFFTHQQMKINHTYRCDIWIPSMNMVIETDGNYWHKYPTGLELDKIRTQELQDKGFKVLRLWESEIKLMTLENFEEKLR